jgi:predicted kinase
VTIWQEYVCTASDLLDQQIKDSYSKNLPVVYDQTNLSEKKRQKKLRLVPSHYKKVAIYFPAYTPELLSQRIKKRQETGGHLVPDDVILKMHSEYKLPSKNEGFDLVISSSHFIDVMKVMDFK